MKHARYKGSPTQLSTATAVAKLATAVITLDPWSCAHVYSPPHPAAQSTGIPTLSESGRGGGNAGHAQMLVMLGCWSCSDAGLALKVAMLRCWPCSDADRGVSRRAPCGRVRKEVFGDRDAESAGRRGGGRGGA
eukprot:CAMPEP_0181207110 /NCGR_PEP_ID=MMETSP1096-20121128/21401_1 /TAXON_ID=156174 ORGANISM="Chrysochromulina ericina, Strain CCMP281" /NCGR_SAMPLE_ID=MMETSP1096 /ASSEMBLY_ACC=CAM_ASM_000453 /LENGTH=133 /DNA_ID=CAMNT_0023298069 /DNA_START=440 /DNA_END=838 /DNA_ORIENTATION=-